MPYTYAQAKKKDFYRNVQDADEQKHLKALEEEKNKELLNLNYNEATDSSI